MYYPMTVIQGQDYESEFTVTDPVTNNPLDITAGHTLVGKIAKIEVNGEPPLYTWPVNASGLVPQVGKLLVRIPGSVSALWTFERVFYSIKVTNTASGAEAMGIRGLFVVVPTV